MSQAEEERERVRESLKVALHRLRAEEVSGLREAIGIPIDAGSFALGMQAAAFRARGLNPVQAARLAPEELRWLMDEARVKVANEGGR